MPSPQIKMDKIIEKKAHLERILAKQIEGKMKCREVLELLEEPLYSDVFKVYSWMEKRSSSKRRGREVN